MKNKTILVVEDDRTVRELLHDFLGMSGFTIHSVDNGLSALKLAGEMHFDIIIADYYIPEMNGLELVAAVRPRYPHALIIGISGNCSKTDFLRAGADVFLPKPFRLQELLSLISN